MCGGITASAVTAEKMYRTHSAAIYTVLVQWIGVSDISLEQGFSMRCAEPRGCSNILALFISVMDDS